MKGPEFACSVIQFLKILKVLALERTKGDHHKSDELVNYFKELFTTNGIIEPNSENLNLENFVEKYVEGKLEIVHLVDLITNKQ